MRKKKNGASPSETELDILRMLWKHGPSTVREMHDRLDREGKTVYTTVLKLMQIMHQKGLLVRDESSRSHVYEAAVSEDDVLDSFVDGVLEQAFEGSASRLVLHALSRRPASKKEVEKIRRLLDELES